MNRILFLVGIVCIILSIAVGLLAIWTDVSPDILGKTFISLVLLFVSTLLTSALTKWLT